MPTWDAATIASPLELQPRSLGQAPSAASFHERYADESVLGEGGMGVVTLCLDRTIGRRVAMKVVREGAGSGADGVARFVREARVQGQLEHPSVVPVYDLGAAPDGRAFFTMKRVRGTTLHDVLNELRTVSETDDPRYSRRRLLTAFGSVCLAVDFAHQHGVIHRDLKPSNIMLGDFGEVYVLDWGLASVAQSEAPVSRRVDVEASGGTTVSGAVMGTPGYMPPEQVRGDPTAMGPWTDVWALGALLFEILTLEPLVDARSAASLLKETIEGVDARASVRAPEAHVPPELEALIERATARDPKERLSSARALSDALEAFLDGERDVELRREMASRHAATARELAAAAKTENSPGFEQRRSAMRELGRALALDPENQAALDALVQLMADPPRRLPSEVETELLGNERHRIRTVGRIGGFAYLSLVLYLPFILWNGVRDARFIVALYVFAAVASAASFWASFRKKPSIREIYVVMVLSNLMFAATAPMFGPLVLTPTLVAVNAVAFSLNLRPRQRLWSILTGVLAAGLPLALTLSGVLPGSISFDGNQMVTTAGAIYLPRIPTMVFVTAVVIGSVITGSLSVARVRDALGEAERQLYLYAWHLRELMPETARAATDPTGARRARAARSPLSR